MLTSSLASTSSTEENIWSQNGLRTEKQDVKHQRILRRDCLQHSMGCEATWRETCCPPGWGMWTRNTRRTRVFFRPTSVSPFLNSMSAFLSFRIPAQSILRRQVKGCEQSWEQRVYGSGQTGINSHGFHVVLWLQRDLQDFGAVDDLLKAGGGDRLACDAMDLIKSVRLEDALICCTDENL